MPGCLPLLWVSFAGKAGYYEWLSRETAIYVGSGVALLVLTGTAVLALDAHRTYVLGWAVAAVVAVGLLLLPLGLIPRAMIALYLAPACGVAVHLVGMVRAARRYRIQESSQTAVPGGQLAARS